jgi:hypothetical protein
MKRIEVENSHDCTVSVQIVETTLTDHMGTRPTPAEICLLIEDEQGNHLATFTTEQAAALEQAIGALRMQLMAKPGEEINQSQSSTTV